VDEVDLVDRQRQGTVGAFFPICQYSTAPILRYSIASELLELLFFRLLGLATSIASGCVVRCLLITAAHENCVRCDGWRLRPEKYY
jgi:hypothetical protein